MAATPKKSRTPAKKRRRAPAKKRATAKKRNGASAPKLKPPIEMKVEGELKYKLKAAQLEFRQEDERVTASLQQTFARLKDQATTKDEKWMAAHEQRKEAVNEAITELTDALAEGYAIVAVDMVEGTVKAECNPADRGKLMD